MDEITVEFADGATVSAHVVASEPAADLALLRVHTTPGSFKVAPLGDSDSVRVGNQVLVVGAPYGLGRSLSVGWISARYPPNTVYRAMPLAEFFKTTTPINQGNSGGPMFDLGGRVIGIVSHNISKSGGSEGLGFIPVGYLASYEKIRDELRRLGPGATLTVTILRAGQIKDLSGRMSR